MPAWSLRILEIWSPAPSRFVPTKAEDDEAFLRQVRARAEEQTRKAKEQRLAREQAERDAIERQRQSRERAGQTDGADPSADPGTD